MKRLVCALDGTWNDDDGNAPLTNVAKLTKAIPLADASGIRQYVRYVAGIATSQDKGLAFLKGAMGFEICDGIKAGYEFLSRLYEPGDEIYLFGFSRGAYQARSLASLITLFGLARKGSKFALDDAWTIYRQAEHKRDFNAVAELSADCHYPARIRCVGVWDTVGNLGNPFWSWGWLSRMFDRHDIRLHDTIDLALHALSIDETRGPFRPSLFTYPEETRLPSRQHVEQVWFAGTHADIGGGWPETHLSDIALLWMAERVQALTGLAIDMEKLQREANPDPLGLQHACEVGWKSAFDRVAPHVRIIEQNSEGTVLARRRRRDKAGRYLLSLNETIHPSAMVRLGRDVQEARGHAVRDIVYEPPALMNQTIGVLRKSPERIAEAVNIAVRTTT